MKTDLTFITNEKNRRLLDRFNVLIKDTKFFDVLVGYFYTSGFYAIYKSLEKTEKIRILIGISTSRQTLDLINQSKSHFRSHMRKLKKNSAMRLLLNLAIQMIRGKLKKAFISFLHGSVLAN